jgi:hypothetical protein
MALERGSQISVKLDAPGLSEEDQERLSKALSAALLHELAALTIESTAPERLFGDGRTGGIAVQIANQIA